MNGQWIFTRTKILKTKYRTLDKTGLEVSAVSVGIWANGGDAWGPVDQIFVDTKVGLWKAGEERPNPYTEPQMITEDCEASLKQLDIEMIDVYQCHLWFNENVEVFAEAFLKLKAQGKIRFPGVSTNDFLHHKYFDWAIVGVDSLQVVYSLFNRGPEGKVLPYHKKNDIGVIVKGPLAMGKFTDKFTSETTLPESDVRKVWVKGENRQYYLRDLERVESFRFLSNGRTRAQAALAYILHNPAVSTIIPGAKIPQQVDDNTTAVNLPLNEDELEKIQTNLSE